MDKIIRPRGESPKPADGLEAPIRGGTASRDALEPAAAGGGGAVAGSRSVVMPPVSLLLSKPREIELQAQVALLGRPREHPKKPGKITVSMSKAKEIMLFQLTRKINKRNEQLNNPEEKAGGGAAAGGQE